VHDHSEREGTNQKVEHGIVGPQRNTAKWGKKYKYEVEVTRVNPYIRRIRKIYGLERGQRARCAGINPAGSGQGQVWGNNGPVFIDNEKAE